MGKWDVDFDDYDSSKGGGYDGETPKKGTYDAVLTSCKEHVTEATPEGGLEWQFEISDGDFKGWRGYLYSNMGTTKWRTQEIVKAIQGGAEKAFKLAPGDDAESGKTCATVKKAKPIRIRLGHEVYDGETRAKVRNVLPGNGGGKAKDVDSDDPVAGGKKGKKKKKDDEPPF